MRSEMKKYGVTYPQILDDDLGYWKALRNRYWPSFYIIDKQGEIRARFSGETHTNDSQARQIEKLIENLTAESPGIAH